MSEYTTILTETHESVGLVQLNRPKEHNALNSTMMTELMDAMIAFDADEAIGAIVITGNERAFAAGAATVCSRAGLPWRRQREAGSTIHPASHPWCRRAARVGSVCTTSPIEERRTMSAFTRGSSRGGGGCRGKPSGHAGC